MNEELTKLLGGLMSNPEALKGLMSSLSAPSVSPPETKPQLLPDIPARMSVADDKRIDLLTALKPYLNTSRGANIDKAIQLIRLAKMTEAMRNEGK